MASGAADRCVRREVAGARKLVDREASFQDVSQFYVEQHRFIVEVFHFDPETALTAKLELDNRARHLAMLIDADEPAIANAWIDAVAVNEPQKLAALAVEGAK